MKKLNILLALAAAAFSSACVVTTTPVVTTYYGSATYAVTVADTVEDNFGNQYFATCTGNVVFSGTFDMCSTHGTDPAWTYDDALLSSDATSSDLYCEFEDGFGTVHNYYYYDTHGEDYFFPAGYITEVCGGSGPRPLALATPSKTAKSDAQLPGGITFKSFADAKFPNGVTTKRVGDVTVKEQE